MRTYRLLPLCLALIACEGDGALCRDTTCRCDADACGDVGDTDPDAAADAAAGDTPIVDAADDRRDLPDTPADARDGEDDGEDDQADTATSDADDTGATDGGDAGDDVDSVDSGEPDAEDTGAADGGDAGDDIDPMDSGDSDGGELDGDPSDAADGGGIPDADPDVSERCGGGMAIVNDTFCIDRYEAMLEEWSDGAWVAASPYLTVGARRVRAVPARGSIPQGYISGTEAAAACAEAGKRLCTNDEWLAACRGPDDTRWPYGETYRSDACNDTYAGGHPVADFFGTTVGIWDEEHMNDPGINQQDGTVTSGGEMTDCVSGWGVFDLHGNLHEWTDDPAGTFRGGFYVDGRINGQGCAYVTTAHTSEYHDYSTGFRCCSDAE